ncbi:MAG: class I SAM-dependent methyltransferase [Acidimicrobiia bacterium]|nr:class I SAM-dependent methyltransferase [Acidimicrobiia bacterium]
MERVPEPELMDDPEQAAAYSAADFAEPHEAFVATFLDRFGAVGGEVLDLGCGPADVTVRLARALPAARLVGVDGAEPMLALARRRVAEAGLGDRVTFELRRLPDPTLLGRRFDAVVSNSLLHHLADPRTLWEAVAACARPGAPVLVMDLRRPPDGPALDLLVEREAAGEPEVLRHDFRASLRAAYRPDEVERQLDERGLLGLAVEPLGDRHLVVSGRAP